MMNRGHKKDPYAKAKQAAQKEASMNAVTPPNGNKKGFKPSEYKKLGNVKTKGFGGKKTAMASGGTMSGKTMRKKHSGGY